jgi:hypothetical protein
MNLPNLLTNWRVAPRGKAAMDFRVEAFLLDVLLLEGASSNAVREGVRRRRTECEKQFRDAEPNKRMKDKAAQSCRALCRTRVVEEIPRRKGTRAAEHLKRVLNMVDQHRRVSHWGINFRPADDRALA